MKYPRNLEFTMNRATKNPRDACQTIFCSRGLHRRIITEMKSLSLLAVLILAGCSSSPTSPTPPPIVVNQPPVAVTPPILVPPPAPAFPPHDPRFDLAFYRKLVHNAYDGPIQPLRRFSQAPRIYLRTIDEDGKPIDGRTLDYTARALEESAGEMTGKFGLAAIERGTDKRLGQAGWLTVQWLPQASNPQRICGQARVGAEGGTLDLYPYQSGCGCDIYQMAPHVVRHELGHALGFWHSDDGHDLMYGGLWDISYCNSGMSAREKYHASVAYDRPIGSPAP